MDITKIQSAGCRFTYIAQPGEHGPRVLVDLRTPFNAAATAAIKASFTAAQWDAIRLWGRSAASYLIEAVNNYAVEDPEIMYSFVSGLGLYRLLWSNGSAYINTGIYANKSSFTEYVIHGKYTNHSASGEQDVISNEKGNAGMDLGIQSNHNIMSYVTPWTSMTASVIKLDASEYDIINVDMHIQKRSFYLSLYPDTVKTNTSDYTPNNSSTPVFLFTCSDRISSRYFKGGLGEAWIDIDGVRLFEMYPFRRNGQVGMLDIQTGTLHTATAGAFTIEKGYYENGVWVSVE